MRSEQLTTNQNIVEGHERFKYKFELQGVYVSLRKLLESQIDSRDLELDTSQFQIPQVLKLNSPTLELSNKVSNVALCRVNTKVWFLGLGAL